MIDNPSTKKALDPRRLRDYYAAHWRWHWAVGIGQWAVALQTTRIGRMRARMCDGRVEAGPSMMNRCR